VDIAIATDIDGRFVCTLKEADMSALVTASNVPQAGEDLLTALENARETGYDECVWAEQGGEFRWIFRRDGARLTVVALWCAGAVIGWQHVFRAEGDFDSFAERARAEVGRCLAEAATRAGRA
jgi:hypothetical protein